MGEQFVSAEQWETSPTLDVPALAERLDRADVLLLKEFYHTGAPYPGDTISHVLCLLADRLRRGTGPLARLSYGAIRWRLDNLVALGLLGKIPQTNPAVYFPLDFVASHIRRIMLLCAADFVGIYRAQEGGDA